MSLPVLAWTVGPMMGGLGAAAASSVALTERGVGERGKVVLQDATT